MKKSARLKRLLGLRKRLEDRERAALLRKEEQRRQCQGAMHQAVEQVRAEASSLVSLSGNAGDFVFASQQVARAREGALKAQERLREAEERRNEAAEELAVAHRKVRALERAHEAARDEEANQELAAEQTLSDEAGARRRTR